MNIKEIKEIIELLKKANVSELELEKPSGKLKVKMNIASTQPATLVVPDTHVKEIPLPVPPKEMDENDHLKTISSPMVGTFYSAASPDTEPFVEENATVKKGETLCIIEAMKLMNEVEAEFDCKITSLLVENAQPVEYGEPLFLVEPA
jgi:acetyl-CoA carboxylase biotin carboxyl carrier protein